MGAKTYWYGRTLIRSSGKLLLKTLLLHEVSVALPLLPARRGKSGQHRASYFLTGRYHEQSG